MIIWLCENACIYALGIQRVKYFCRHVHTPYPHMHLRGLHIPVLGVNKCSDAVVMNLGSHLTNVRKT